MSKRFMLKPWASALAIALAAAPVAWWVLLRSGRTGWNKFVVLWIACYCGVIVFGIAAALLFSWLRPLLARQAAPALEDAAARAKFEEMVMVAIIAAGLFALLSVLIR
jgi:hypothetical protein